MKSTSGNGDVKFSTPTKHKTESPLKNYLDYINSFKKLTFEETVELAKRIENGDEEARKTLIEHNLRFAYDYAKRFVGFGLDFDDLLQEANEGMYYATNKYDYRRGCTFCFYSAYYMKRNIQRALAATSLPTSIPVNTYSHYVKLRRISSNLEAKLNRKPTIEELSSEMQLDKEHISELLMINPAISINSPIDPYDFLNTKTILDTIPSDEESEELVFSADFTSYSVSRPILNNTEQKVLSLFLGINTDVQMKPVEIARFLGVKRQYIHTVLKSAYNKLKKVLSEIDY